MQLSWIDPEALRALAAKLQDPEPPKSAGLRDAGAMHALAFERAVEASLMAPGAPVEAPGSAAPPPRDEFRGEVASPDPQVARIRQQLEIVRARAQQAGLLQPVAPEPAAPDAARLRPRILPPDPIAAAALTASASPPEPAAAPPPAPASAAHPAVEKVPSPEPVRQRPEGPPALEGNLGERLEKFARWAGQRVSADEWLMVDDHGDVLWGSPGRSDLAFTALLSLNAALRSSAGAVCAPPAVIRSQLSADRELTLLPCQTRHGTVTLAMLNARGLPSQSLGELRDGLISAIEGRPN